MLKGECHFSVGEALPLVCVCTLFSFLCGVGIGGNDLSANFAMVVGSGSLNMKQAIIYCTVFEILGCVFMGAHVSGTIRNGIADPRVYDISAESTIIGMTAASLASALWLFASAIWGLPVSITHTVVGSILGFAVFSQGSFAYVQYNGIVLVMLSWIAAPLLSAAAAAAFFGALRSYVMKTRRPMKSAEAALPYCLATSLTIELVFVFIGRPPVLDELAVFLPLRTAFLGGMFVIAAICVYAKEFIFPRTVAETTLMEHFPWDAPTLTTTARGGGGTSGASSGDDGAESGDESASPSSMSPVKKEPSRMKRVGSDRRPEPLDHTAYVQAIDDKAVSSLSKRRSSMYRLSSLTTADSKLSTGEANVKIVPVVKHHHHHQKHHRAGQREEKPTVISSATGAPISTAAVGRISKTSGSTQQQREVAADGDEKPFKSGTSSGTPSEAGGAASSVPRPAMARKKTRCFVQTSSPSPPAVPQSPPSQDGAAKKATSPSPPDAAFGEFTQSFPARDSSTRESIARALQEHRANSDEDDNNNDDDEKARHAAAVSVVGGYAHILSPSKSCERRPPPLVIPKSPLPSVAAAGAGRQDILSKTEREMGVIVYELHDSDNDRLQQENEDDDEDEMELTEGTNQFNRQAEYLFTILQVVAGAASSFVHGAVAGANATAPFVVLYQSFSEHILRQSSSLPSGWVSFPASLGIAVGMYSLGTKLMKTVGLELVTVTPVRGWSIQVGGTLITMICTGIGIPVSLSQCQVGAAIGVGVVDGGMKQVAWRTVMKIIGGWLVTLFVAASTTGALMRMMTHYYC